MISPLDMLAESRAAIGRSLAQNYLGSLDESRRQLQQAVNGLQTAQQRIRTTRPGAEERGLLLVELKRLKQELRRAEIVHSNACAIQSGWALQLAAVMGIEPAAGYGRETLPQIARAASRMTFEA